MPEKVPAATNPSTLLTLTTSFFDRLRLPLHLLERLPGPEDPLDPALDQGLRQEILQEARGLFQVPEITEDFGTGSTILFLEDRYQLRYILFPLEGRIALVGPYILEPADEKRLKALMERCSIPSTHLSFLYQYYVAVTRIESQICLESYLLSLAELLYPEERQVLFVREEQAPSTYTTRVHVDTSQEMARSIEARYRVEEEMLEAIAAGDEELAVSKNNSGFFASMDRRNPSMVQSTRNYLIIMNTMGRKAAQRGGVHPVYLDELSRRLALQIENTSNLAELNAFFDTIIRSYARLVRLNSTRAYTKPVRDAVNYISFHCTEEGLSLSTVADTLSLNHSYLATLYKKETGETVLQTIQKKRMEYALTLLDAGEGSVSDIAAACGIPDTTYFIRLFKRHQGMTPGEYIKSHRTP